MWPIDGLPDPHGQLSLTLPSSSIVEANHLVQLSCAGDLTEVCTVQDVQPHHVLQGRKVWFLPWCCSSRASTQLENLLHINYVINVVSRHTHSFFLNSKAKFGCGTKIFVVKEFCGWLEPWKFNMQNIFPMKLSVYTVLCTSIWTLVGRIHSSLRIIPT